MPNTSFFKCPFCIGIYPSQSNLEMHIHRVHELKEAKRDRQGRIKSKVYRI